MGPEQIFGLSSAAHLAPPANVSTWYLVAAFLCLILALRMVWNALVPIGALIQAAAAALLMVIAIVAAIALLTLALPGLL